MASQDALKPQITLIAGPLIRIIGDRIPWQAKKAILDSLSFAALFFSLFKKYLVNPFCLMKEKSKTTINKTKNQKRKLIAKGQLLVKSFIPQLQGTFLKALSDSTQVSSNSTLYATPLPTNTHFPLACSAKSLRRTRILG